MENITLLIEKSRGGDRDAFARIVEQYQGMVSAVTLNIVGDYAQSEDLAQETFLTAWKKLPELREPEKSASWFYGIAKRVALHWRQRQQKNPLQGAAELDEQTLADHQAETDRRRQQEQSLELVWSTVKELPEIFREPLLLYYRYSKSTADIAASMELTEEAVRQRLSRGRKLLKAEVEKQVESVLEATRPDTAFTLAVLASLPLAATTTGCTVTGTGTATGTKTGWFGWFGWWTPFLWLLLPIILITGGFAGLWTALKHSPTIRTRRFMCLAAIQWYAFIWAYIWILGNIAQIISRMGMDNYSVFYTCYYVILTVFCFRLVYRWRMLLEEDAGLRSMPTKPLEKTSLSLFRLRCWYWSTLLPIVILSALVLFSIISEFSRDRLFVTLDDAWKAVFLTIVCVLWMSIPTGFFVIVGYGIRTARDEDSLVRWYPRQGKTFLPKPEDATCWSYFWFDLAVMYAVTILPIIPLAASALIIDGMITVVLIATMMMTVTTLIASHSAGIPGKRLKGYTRVFFCAGIWYMALLVFKTEAWHCPVHLVPGSVIVPLPILFAVLYFGTALTAFVLLLVTRR